MFSWDDKTAGAQVLLAQLTGDGGYTGKYYTIYTRVSLEKNYINTSYTILKADVKNYYNWLKNSAKRTPKGLNLTSLI